MNPDEIRPIKGQPSLWFGGDYNPEQWPREVWREDIEAFQTLGVDTVTLPVFGWSAVQPAKDKFEFGWLDEILDLLASSGIGVVMATPTAAQPAWMSAAYPEILPVDTYGRRRRHGGRVNYCPTSSAYRESAAQVAAALADRYAGYEGLRLWHINNEYGPVCYCEGCREEFQRWLANRHPDIESLNEAWGASFWGNRLQDWSEIEFPSQLNAMTSTPEGWVRFSPSPGATLDHFRFVSSTLLSCFLNEKQVIRELTPQTPITTNFHGPVQTVDWAEWAPHLDLISWDSYPGADSHWTRASFGHDLARGSGGRGEFLVMEMSPGPVNWQPMNTLKAPGTARLQAFQAVARGSRGALFFQARQSRAGNELNHSGLVPRHGRLDTRMGEELIRLGSDLKKVGVPPDTHRLRSEVAVIFDWPSWWAHHATPGLDQKSRYIDTARSFHRVLSERGFSADVVGVDTDWSRYQLVVAPMLYLVEPELAAALEGYVEAGGVLVTTALSGVADRHGGVHHGGVEPTWRHLFGLWVEEVDARDPSMSNRVRFTGDESTVAAREIFEILRLEAATPLASFEDDFYRGSPALTINHLGDGKAIYLASPSGELFDRLLDHLQDFDGSWPVPDGVESVFWEGDVGDLVFLLNHGRESVEVDLPPGEWIDLIEDRALETVAMMPPAGLVVAMRRPA